MTINLDLSWVKRELEPLFVVQKTGKWEPVIDILPDFCPIVFNPANQIIHPARYWALFRHWRGEPLSDDKEPSEWLYRGMDEVAGEVLVVLDEELQLLKDAFYRATGAEGCKAVIPLKDVAGVASGCLLEGLVGGPWALGRGQAGGCAGGGREQMGCRRCCQLAGAPVEERLAKLGYARLGESATAPRCLRTRCMASRRQGSHRRYEQQLYMRPSAAPPAPPSPSPAPSNRLAMAQRAWADAGRSAGERWAG